MYLEELSKYKVQIMQEICASESIIRLLRTREHYTIPDEKLMYKCIFPYAWINETIVNASTFICFDLEVLRVENRTFKDISILFWIFTHQSLMKVSGGIRTDILSNEVDKIFNGSRRLGLGVTKLQKVGRINPAKDYYGRTLVYTSTDFNRVV